MRIVVILLLLANLALFALTRLDAYSGGESQRLGEQVQPEKIKLLTAQEVAALGSGEGRVARRTSASSGARSPTSSATAHWASSRRSASRSSCRSAASTPTGFR